MAKKWAWVPFPLKRWKKKRSRWTNRNLRGIRGWLLFYAISPAYHIISFLLILLLLLILPNLIFNHFSEVYSFYMPYRGFFIFNMVYSGIYAAFKLFIAVVFFMKKRYTPKLIVWFYILFFIFGCVNLLIALNIDIPKHKFIFNLIHQIIISCIWIPYFMVSQRVKATFVK